MGRRYKIKDVRAKINELRKNIPEFTPNQNKFGSGFTFSTDIIVGFPGETEKEFKETIRLIKEIRELLGKRFTKIHIFRYSAKEGTLAAKMESSFANSELATADKGKKGWERVSELIKKQRAKKIQNIFKNPIIHNKYRPI